MSLSQIFLRSFTRGLRAAENRGYVKTAKREQIRNMKNLVIAEQIADQAFELCKGELAATRSPEMRFALLLKTLAWEDVEAQVIAACRRKAGL